MAAGYSTLTSPEFCPDTMLDPLLEMTLVAEFPPSTEVPAVSPIAEIVREGLTRNPKQLPPWLFYDAAGSQLFEEITALPEYYLTRLERGIFVEYASEMIAAAAGGQRLRMAELGAGSADKTRMLLAAGLAQQGSLEYLPVDVSATALEMARSRLESELPEVVTTPVVADYTVDWNLPQPEPGTRQLLLWIGSSIGNFEPEAAIALLRRIQETMQPGDGLLLGVDLAPCDGGKCVGELLAAYDDDADVTARFNSNLLVRLNRELGAEFDLDTFAHCAEWNEEASRIEMHLESLKDQWVRIEALDMDVHFTAGERIHTENSYKYTLERAAELMEHAGFPVVERWTDGADWFSVFLGRKA